MVVQQGLLLERDTRIFISAPTLRGLHEAVAERLGITEPFHIWMLAVQPTGSTAGDELRLVESLDQLSDASTIHLELEDTAVAQRAIDAANQQLFEEIKTDMAEYMARGGSAKFETWLRESAWMRDTGGPRDEAGVPKRAQGSVVKDLWAEQAAWHAEKQRDAEKLRQ